MGPRLLWPIFMDLQWEMHTWNSHLASSCRCGASLHPLSYERLHLGAGTSLTGHLVWRKNCCPLPCACIFTSESLCECTVNTSLLAIGLLRQRNGCENSWGIRRWICLPPKHWDLQTAQSPDTQHSCAKRNMHMHAIICSCAHKGVFHYSLHHTFQDVSSSVSHFSSLALHLEQTTLYVDWFNQEDKERRVSCAQIGSCSSGLLVI